MIERITDEQIKTALIETSGQPTKVAEVLGVTYPCVYMRIRKNPELLEIQRSNRSKAFNEVSSTMIDVALNGIINEPLIDENGEIIKGKFREVPVDYKTRLTAMQTIINTFKVDEGISEKLEITKNETITGFILSD